MEGIKENRQDVKGKLEQSKLTLEELTQDSPKARPGEFTLEKLGFFSSNSPKQGITRLGKKSLILRLTRLNMRREA